MKFEILFLGLLSITVLLTSLLPSALGDPSDNLTIDVQIGSVAELRLNDTGVTSVDFGSVNPGSNSSSDVLIRAHNVGSTTLSNLYASVDSLSLTSSNPRTTGTDTDWATTNFLALANDTSSPDYYYIGKIVWNYSASEDSSNFTFDDNVDAWGEYWAGGDSDPGSFWYWQLNGSAANNDWCNESESTLKINNARGDMDVSSGTSMTNEDQGEDWATFTIGSGPWSSYCVYAYYDCTRLYVTRWDFNSTFTSTCTKEEYLYPSSLAPGNYKDFLLREIIPYGIPSGNPTDTNLRIYATSS